MSPRAAWRLEALAYTPVYDYVLGKADWLAAGLPSEGNRTQPPRAAEAIDRSVPTCSPNERIASVVARLALTGPPICVVVEHQVVQGRLRVEHLTPADTRTAEEVMEPGPATIRADANLAETLGRMTDRNVTSLIVSTPEGVLLGAVYNEVRKDPPQ